MFAADIHRKSLKYTENRFVGVCTVSYVSTLPEIILSLFLKCILLYIMDTKRCYMLFSLEKKLI